MANLTIDQVWQRLWLTGAILWNQCQAKVPVVFAGKSILEFGHFDDYCFGLISNQENSYLRLSWLCPDVEVIDEDGIDSALVV